MNIAGLLQTQRLAQFIFVAVLLLLPSIGLPGAREDANAVIDRWSAAYSSNDPEAVVKNYRTDAILLGTVSPVLSQGTEAIRKYFSGLKGSGNKNVIGEKYTLVLSDNAVLVTGFYEFIRMKEGQPVPGPARFTMLLIKDGNEWLIAHHHSSPRVN
jgi:uncharacterized protein (TIGR02246 family)